MQFVFNRKRVCLGLLAGVLALSPRLVGCGGGNATNGSSGNGNGGTSSGGSDGGTTPGPGAGGSATDAMSSVAAQGSCPNPTIKIDFSPMYSAFIPNNTLHAFTIPAVTDDGQPATWSVSDSTQVKLGAQNFGVLPGVLITVVGPGTGTTGQVTVFATESDGSCGASVLTITTSTENDWTIGNNRYNDGVSLSLMTDGGGMRFGGRGPTDGGSFFERDGGTACTTCHGPTATNGPYKQVSHSPEQTGGFSDQDLIGIFTRGVIPDGGYFDPAVIIGGCDGGAMCTQAAMDRWHTFHRWDDITPDQYPGIIVYLRSITPMQQNGMSNFGGGGFNRDGGGRRRDGGRFMPDSGGPDEGGPDEGGSTSEAGGD